MLMQRSRAPADAKAGPGLLKGASLPLVTAFCLSGCGLMDLNDEIVDDIRAGLADTDAVDIFSIDVGDCLASLDAHGGTEQVARADVVACSEPHAYEVYHEATFAGASLEELDAEADSVCSREFQSFIEVDIETEIDIETILEFTSLSFTALRPTQASYDDGDREVSCLAHRYDLALVEGSLRGEGAAYVVQVASFFEQGDCWAVAEDVNGTEAVPSEVVPCNGPHVFEVYSINFLPDGLSPPFDEPASEQCLQDFETFVGVPYETSAYFFEWYQPEPETYNLGDRRVACLITTADYAPVSGSLEGSAR